MSSMQAYLASKYMSGPKADAILARASTSSTVPKKKKKRRDVTEAEVSLGGSFIKDDDELRWGKPMEVDDENEGTPVVEKDRSFKKRKVDPAAQEGGAGWITIRGGDAEDGEDADTQPTGDVAPKFVGGLVPASELQTVLPQSSAKRKGKGRETSDEPPPEAQETVYRDASGRKIDMKLEKAAAAREKRLREEKESAKMEWGKGLVQREEADRLKREEEAEKTRGLARYADDKDLNEMQKAQDRWNDPAAAFLTKKEKKGPRKPLYNGPPPPPNRFGVLPGYRWDGVDRGNGFEKKYFQRLNERGRTKLEAYQWSVDDM